MLDVALRFQIFSVGINAHHNGLLGSSERNVVRCDGSDSFPPLTVVGQDEVSRGFGYEPRNFIACDVHKNIPFDL